MKVGATLTLLGFLAVGFAVLSVGLAPTSTTPEQLLASQTAAKSVAVVQGFGWIVAGLGLFMAFFGSAKSDTAIDTKSEILLGGLPPRRQDRTLAGIAASWENGAPRRLRVSERILIVIIVASLLLTVLLFFVR